MNKRLLTLFLLSLVLFLGCSKDSDVTEEPTQIDKSANLKATGSSANDILSDDKFDKLLIEIAYVQGFRPTSTAMINFEAFLRKYTFKQNIEVIYKELPSSNEDTFSLEEIVELEVENRTAFNNEKTLAIYIYFADAPSEDDDEDEDLVTLGAVYLNTSMVIYEHSIRNLASKSFLVSVADVETATLNHEFGHLLGLVDLGSNMVNDHEDSEAENHCTTDGCLMRAELQFGSAMKKMLENRASKGLVNAPDLGAECMLDLQTNGGR